MYSAAAFFLFFIACIVLAFVRHPIYGLALYLTVFFVHPPSRWWGSMLPDLRWSFVAGAIALLAVIVHGRKLDNGARPWYSTAPGLALLLFVIWFWIQNFWALNPEGHYTASVQYTKYLVAFYLVYRLATGPKESADILLIHVAGCAFLGALCVYQGRSFGARLDGVGGPGINDANSLGMYIATGLAIGAMLMLTLKGWRRIAVLLALPIILDGLFYTGSRGAFVGLLAGGAVVYFLCPPQRKWVFWGCVVLGLVAAASLVDDKFVERMFSIRSAVESRENIDSSAEGRLVLLEAQVKMAARYPHGAGFRGTSAMSREFLDEKWLSGAFDPSERERSSHNTFMSALVEQGIPGAILYIWLCLWGVMAVGRLKALQWRHVGVDLTAPAVACCAGIAVVWTAGQFTDYLQTEVQIWLFALLAASLEQIRLATSPAQLAVADSPDTQTPIAERRAT
jgi:hypothetical protein